MPVSIDHTVLDFLDILSKSVESWKKMCKGAQECAYFVNCRKISINITDETIIMIFLIITEVVASRFLRKIGSVMSLARYCIM